MYLSQNLSTFRGLINDYGPDGAVGSWYGVDPSRPVVRPDSSPMLLMSCTVQQVLLEHGRRRRIRLDRRTFQALRAGWSSGRVQAKAEYTAARGRRDHATFREQANTSVRCTGLGARLLATSDEVRSGYIVRL
jgi:hypothetical protein